MNVEKEVMKSFQEVMKSFHIACIKKTINPKNIARLKKKSVAEYAW